MARGSGVAQIQRFAFNTNTKQCEPFIYTGIGGNQNNFLTMADCTQMCNGLLQFHSIIELSVLRNNVGFHSV